MRLVRAAPLIAAAVLLGGCGGGGSGGNGVADKSADEIVADALAAAKTAESVHVAGRATGESLEIDVRLVAGEGGQGHLVVDRLAFDIVRIGDRAYFRGDETFWTQFGGGEAAELFEGRWVEASAVTGDLASLTPLTDVAQLFDGILGDHGTLEKGDETDVDGTPAIAIEDTTEGGTLYVATEGEPYPLRIDGPEDSPGSIVFDEWNEEVSLETPEETVDLEKLQSG